MDILAPMSNIDDCSTRVSGNKSNRTSYKPLKPKVSRTADEKFQLRHENKRQKSTRRIENEQHSEDGKTYKKKAFLDKNQTENCPITIWI